MSRGSCAISSGAIIVESVGVGSASALMQTFSATLLSRKDRLHMLNAQFVIPGARSTQTDDSCTHAHTHTHTHAHAHNRA